MADCIREKLRQKVRATKKEDNIGWAAIAKKRVALRVEIKLVRALQKAHMPALEDLLNAEEATGDNVDEEDKPEEEALYLPSCFPVKEREDYGLIKLAQREMEMRKTYANSELELLRLSIRLYFVNVQIKRTNVSGGAAMTRANIKLQKDTKRRFKHQRRYMLHYKAMLSLGYDESDATYREITEIMVSTAKDVTKTEDLGSGRMSDAWFWKEGKDVASMSKKKQKDLKDLNDEGAL